MKKVFIDGKAGTTGLRIYERLETRDDIALIVLSDERRKDPAARRDALNSADIAFLCLPDDAARESVSMTENPETVIIDTSTAHRTDPAWAYAFPELSPEFEEKMKASKRISVPGCHASGFIALVHPLIKSGLLSPSSHLSCHSITGYSGGGKSMIAQYEADGRDALLSAPRQYALGQTHKHLREMTAVCRLDEPPVFCPIVADFYSGMAVTVPLFASDIGGTVDDIKRLYAETYAGEIVKYTGSADADGLYSAAALSGKDSMEISVFGNEERILLCARYDNLGKGASGAAVEAMNIKLGVDRRTGLAI